MAENERKEETYGPFEVLEPLGVGAMATVHRGIERGVNGFERVVAIKRLLPHLVEDVEFVRAFVREAKLASLLHHGNIVQLYELGRVGASYFISMEYIRGRDLRVLLRQARRVCGPPPVEVTISLLTQLLDALDYAHQLSDVDGNPLGLIHRDISPANLIVSNTGHLKVIDFGIAKATFGHLMTHSGRIKGKLAYMAPETLSGRPLDGRSDLFATSIIAYELLTAAPLFAARDDFQIIDRLQNMQPQPPSARNPNCPVELDRIVLRGLAKDPDKRWRTAADMRQAIAQFAVDQRLLATNREVSTWVDEAFQRTAPVATTRLRLPLAPPPNVSGDPRQGGSGGETDDELMEIVWGMSTPRSLPVVLDEVPDVSSKHAPLSPSALAASGDPSGVVHRSDASIILVSSAQGADRNGQSQEPSRTGPGLGLGQSQLPGVAPLPPRWASTTPRQGSTASARAMGTGPMSQISQVSQSQPQGILEEAMYAAQRAEAMAMAAMATRRRRSLIPFIMAAIAVAAAGGGVAWLLSGRRPDPVVASAGQGAQLPPAALPGTSVQGLPPAGGGGGNQPPAPAAVVTSSNAPASNAAAPTAAAADGGKGGATAAADEAREDRAEARADDREEDRDDDRRTRRARAKRDRVARRDDRERRRDDEDRDSLAADESEDEESVAESLPAPPVTPPASQTTAATTESTTERDRNAPLPVTVEPPAPEPPRAAQDKTSSPRPSGPIIVSADRAKRASGNEHPIRFPHGEQLPPKITAKLCVDTGGTVTSVTVLSTVSAKVRHTVERELSLWRYKPVTEGGNRVAACFATAFPVQQVE